MRTHYAPPPLDRAWLLAALKDTFPSHQTHRNTVELLEELVAAYSAWWWLMLTYPERRIVGTPPLWVVRVVHASVRERFLTDCIGYLGKILTKERVWRGELDFRGTHDTVRSLNEMFDRHQLVWQPILTAAKQQSADRIIRIH